MQAIMTDRRFIESWAKNNKYQVGGIVLCGVVRSVSPPDCCYDLRSQYTSAAPGRPPTLERHHQAATSAPIGCGHL